MFLAYVFTLAPLASLARIGALAGGSVGGVADLALPGEIVDIMAKGRITESIAGVASDADGQEGLGLVDTRVAVGLLDAHALAVAHEPIVVVRLGGLRQATEGHEEQEDVDDTPDHEFGIVR